MYGAWTLITILWKSVDMYFDGIIMINNPVFWRLPTFQWWKKGWSKLMQKSRFLRIWIVEDLHSNSLWIFASFIFCVFRVDIFGIKSLASLSMIPFMSFSSVPCEVVNILKEKVLNWKTFGSFWKFLSVGLTWTTWDQASLTQF